MSITVMNPVKNQEVLPKAIIQRVFDLSKKQLECFMNIFENEMNGTCILNLVDNMESERSIIQKNLKTLMKKGLVERKAVTLAEFKERCIQTSRLELKPKTNKGYLYIYNAISPEDLLKKIKQIMNEWDAVLKDTYGKI